MTHHISAPTRRRTAANAAWLVGYLAVMAGMIWGVLRVRDVTIRNLSTPEALAEWKAWREAAPNQPDAAPVRRQPPTTVDPPALIMMRDRFAAVMAATVIFTSLFYFVMMVALRGAFASGDSPDTDNV